MLKNIFIVYIYKRKDRLILLLNLSSTVYREKGIFDALKVSIVSKRS